MNVRLLNSDWCRIILMIEYDYVVGVARSFVGIVTSLRTSSFADSTALVLCADDRGSSQYG